MLTQNCLKRLQNLRWGPPRLLSGLPDATPSPTYLGASPQLESTTTLFTLYYNAMVINQHIYRNVGGAALPPHRLRGPLPLSPTRAPRQQSLVVTPAPAGLNAQLSGHQLWHQSLTTGHQKQGVLHHPL